MTEDSPHASRIDIRLVREDEWREYRELRLKALETDPLAFGSTRERENAFDEEAWRKRISERVASRGSATWVAVEASGHFVGATAVADFEGGLHLFAMWVEPEFRRAGIGGRLLDTAIAWVGEFHPGRALQLGVNPGQSAAVRLYRSRGFALTGGSSPLGHTPSERVVDMALAPAAEKSSTS